MTLKDYRKNKGLTQADVAKRFNIKQSTVAMWESGASIPRTENITKLADLLGISVDQLLECFERRG